MTSLRAVQEIPQQLPDVDLPGGVAPFLRIFFSVPQGVQMAGGIVAALVALGLLIWIIRKRVALLAWLRTRSRGVQIGLASLAAVVLVLAVTGGTVSWNYMQHDNDFCTGCHVMGPAYLRFTQSGHAELSCHDCHRQSIFASARQLHLWVKDRPAEIGEHAPVPSEVCAQCHINDDPAENWPQIAATQGHLAHLESDSSALANIQCVTCHGQEVHQFRPADQTCGQAGCHAPDRTQIVLGDMTGAEGLHCVACHDFTAPREVATPVDSATALLTPGLAQCTSCHEMEELFAGYDPLRDPHEGRCGACHNPHVQDRPELALRACTDAGCHARPDTLSTFHIGLPDEVTQDCTECHKPHVWVRDGNDCASCHADVLAAATGARRSGAPAAAEGRVRPAAAHLAGAGAPTGPTALHLAAAGGLAPPRDLRSSTSGTDGAGSHGALGRPDESGAHHGAAAGSGSPSVRPPPPGLVAQQQSFSHRQHANVECTACHSNRSRHGEVTVRTQSDCFECHHATSTAAVQGCGGCHSARELGRVRNVTLTLRMSVWSAPRVRALPFDHGAHDALRCVDCHGGGIRQRVQATCSDCHEDHHPQSGDTACAACHEEHRTDAHTAEVHTEGCTGSGCHTEPRFTRMERTRQFCTACHQGMANHEPGQLCTSCHLVPTGPPGARREQE